MLLFPAYVNSILAHQNGLVVATTSQKTNNNMLQLRNLSIGLGEESCIGFTQENLIENSLQDLSLLIYVVTLVHATTMLFLP